MIRALLALPIQAMLLLVGIIAAGALYACAALFWALDRLCAGRC